MPFEAFLNETHKRPSRNSRFGFLASAALHCPPVTWFMTTWLTHATVIGTSGLPAEPHPSRGTYYIPISLYGEGPGGGDPLAKAAAPGGTRPRSGLLGRSGRAGRRGLIAPRDVKRPSAKSTWNDPFMLGSYASSDPHGSVGATAGTGDGRAGNGNGSGLVGDGRGGTGQGGAGNGMLAATLAERSKEKVQRDKGQGDARDKSKEKAAPEDDHEIGTDLDVVVEAGRAPVRAAYISQDSAAYYRTHDDMPGLPQWLAGHRDYAMLFRICVSTEGTVSNVVVLKSANEDADQVLCNAIQKWRYRPRIVDGVARPFCHPIRIVYSRP